jgi:ABC-2 type transport system permease protein
MAFGFFLSALIKNPAQSSGLFFGVFFLTYVAGMASKMVNELSFLAYFSPYQYAEPAALLKEGYKLENLGLSFLIITASIIGCYLLYRRKDLKI